MNTNNCNRNKLLILSILTIVLIIIYCQYFTNYEENYTDFVLLTNAQEDPPEVDVVVPLTWKETDQKLFDLDFEFIIKSHICDRNSGKNISAVIIVTSYFGDVELRSAMRRSFTAKELLDEFGLLRVFLLGLSPPKETYVSQKQVENEAERFGDIVQGNFQEAYRNLTYKHLMGLLWASDNCKTVKYIMKMDDDVVVDMYRLQKDIVAKYVLPQQRAQFLAGFSFHKGPVRNSSSKWFVSNQEYPSEIYPPYLSGWFYITTRETAKRLVHIGRKMKYFWIDDVFITGIVAKRLNIKHFRLNYFYATNHFELKCCMEETMRSNFTCRYIFGPNGGENNLFYEFNLVMKKCSVYPNSCAENRTSKCENPNYKEKNFERFLGDGVKKADGVVEIYKLR